MNRNDLLIGARAACAGRVAVVFAAAMIASTAAGAQQVMGIGEQALGPSRGVFRLTIAPSFETFDERFLPDGETEALGARLTTDALGGSHVPFLAATSQAVQVLGGGASFSATLGSASLRASTSVNTINLGGEFGLTNRLSVMANVPIVRTRSELLLELDGATGSVGINPALLDQSVATVHDNALSGQASAVASLQTLLTTCGAGGSDPRCPTVQANQAALQALLTDANAAASAAALLYGVNAPFAPLDGGSEDVAIAARLDALSAAFASWGSLGLPAFPGGVFTGARAPVGTREAHALLSDPGFGIGVDSLITRTRYALGDVEVGARLLLIDTPGRAWRFAPRGMGLRLAVVAGARLGTGEPPDPDQPFDPGTGDGQTDLIGAAHLDLLFGDRFWATVTGRYVRQLDDRLTMRVAAPSTVLPSFDSRAEIDRKLGDVLEFEVAPRVVLGRYLSIGARYAYRDKELDEHEYADPSSVPGSAVDAGVLDSATAYTEQELGAGFTFSTVSAAAIGLAVIPIEMSYQHVESLSAENGFRPKRSRDELRVRVYVRLFGR